MTEFFCRLEDDELTVFAQCWAEARELARERFQSLRDSVVDKNFIQMKMVSPDANFFRQHIVHVHVG